jgi:hypothetical protein
MAMDHEAARTPAIVVRFRSCFAIATILAHFEHTEGAVGTAGLLEHRFLQALHWIVCRTKDDVRMAAKHFARSPAPNGRVLLLGHGLATLLNQAVQAVGNDQTPLANLGADKPPLANQFIKAGLAKRGNPGSGIQIVGNGRLGRKRQSAHIEFSTMLGRDCTNVAETDLMH